MYGEQSERDAALIELRQRLSNGLAKSKLDKTQLARVTRLGRTTVSEAFQPGGPVPSARTVAALSRTLGLHAEEMLVLRRSAAGDTEARPAVQDAVGPGKPISEWDPYDLEIHPTGSVAGGHGLGSQQLPGYVHRRHDRVLGEAVRDAQAGRSQMVILVGASSTGKTRACWEAVQLLAGQGWRLWHPFDPTRAGAALVDLERVQPRTVVWLNEAQHYLGDVRAGERIAAAVHTLLTSSTRMPVLVLGTLWPEYDRQYMALPEPGKRDRHSRVRELLAGRTVPVPDSFDAEALRTAIDLALDGDSLLADALRRAGSHGRVTQDLAGAPELLRRYEHGTPAARALLEAAMDARRLGVGLHLPQMFLTDAATDYLSDFEYEDLTDDWAEAAFAELAQPVHGRQAPLRRVRTRPTRHPSDTLSTVTSPRPARGTAFHLADYLEQNGYISRGRLCPPGSFWHAAYTHITDPDDLNRLAEAAQARYRLQWAYHFRQRAADEGDSYALIYLADRREEMGDEVGAQALYRRAANAGHTSALINLAYMREAAGDQSGSESLARQAAEAGDLNALVNLARMREEAGDEVGAEALYRLAVDGGQSWALVKLAYMRELTGDGVGSEDLYRLAAKAGLTSELVSLARTREEAGDEVGAEALYRVAANAGHTYAWVLLAEMREKAGDAASAEVFARRAAAAGNPNALADLVLRREERGDDQDAEVLAREAAEAGNGSALANLALRRVKAGNQAGALVLACEAAEVGDTRALIYLAELRDTAGDAAGAEALYRQAADAGDDSAQAYLRRRRAVDEAGAEALAREAAEAGDTGTLIYLVEMREAAGDRAGAEVLAREVAHAGDASTLMYLALKREKSGDQTDAEALYREALNAGDISALAALSRMREEAEDQVSAEELARQLADAGDTSTLTYLALSRGKAGNWEAAEVLAQEAAAFGDTSALINLALSREGAGDQEAAKVLARQVADTGDASALIALARRRAELGDWRAAEALARQVADAGHAHALTNPAGIFAREEVRRALRAEVLWPHGLNPDGTPASEWTL